MTPLIKTFVLLQLGKPHAWMDQFLGHVEPLARYGWRWIIATPHALAAPANVRILPMTAEQFADRCASATGVRPNLFITQNGVPSVHVTDYCVAFGEVFAPELVGSDFWGMTNLDVVYGRLERFISDDEIDGYDVWADDVDTVNGVFTLFRNTPRVNALYRRIPHWQGKFAQPPCPRCVSGVGEHTLFGTDEYDLTAVLRSDRNISFGGPRRFPLHSHDRLEQRVPQPKLARDDDGTLWELFADMAPPAWEHARPLIGREIPWFHFNRTKQWPLQ